MSIIAQTQLFSHTREIITELVVIIAINSSVKLVCLNTAVKMRALLISFNQCVIWRYSIFGRDPIEDISLNKSWNLYIVSRQNGNISRFLPRKHSAMVDRVVGAAVC